ncbi:putative exopolyphosphatase [Aspergillus homomorphus CBS 101889]|uniref:DHH phosphoesterase n=1 Tax=Aspergillus homomorphus (strain CBS 101889) TaxID=1450537 RepID=A0A395HNZ4_ASPHC|nr:DHH phosphoesterase [Aspergillus homomorphus CBS 101889]RAL09153.1 DHH phosphoesterase [Aspergillus homomorphus CBS 101889]
MRALDRSLFQFLAQSLQTHHRFLTGRITRPEDTPIYVIGNPSADLDSIISALVYAYFTHQHPRPHVPLINLADVPSGPELRRLRPEFIEALRLATHPEQQPKDLHNHILTVADFAAHLTHLPENNGRFPSTPIDAILVDWNALPNRHPTARGQGTLPGLSDITFNVVGCIDHHADEHFLPPIAADQPFLIQPTGSCTSLVVSMLERMGRWVSQPSSPSSPPSTTEEDTRRRHHGKQLSKLALAPILIDTANFTAKEKVTDADTLSYSFLRAKINSVGECGGSGSGELHGNGAGAAAGQQAWDHNALYRLIAHAKENSLELLTVDEVLGRDYKEWVVVPSTSSKKKNEGDAGKVSHSSSPDNHQNAPRGVKIGICSVVKSLPWVIRKADTPARFWEVLETFAAQRELDVVVVMTAFSASSSSATEAEGKEERGRFARELLVCVPDRNRKVAVEGVRVFVERAQTALGLEEWRALSPDDEDVVREVRVALERESTTDIWKGVWVQGDVSKSRKQVAPLLREAVGSV